MIDDLLDFVASNAWILAIALLVVAILMVALAIRLRRPALGLAGVVPPALGALGLVFGFDVQPADPIVWPIVAIGLAILGVLGGNPLTVFVLGLASTVDPTAGAHGGIVVRSKKGAKKGPRQSREVLRGGWVIGYLERVAIIAAIVLGHVEIIAGVIAIKGLGRFSELDSAEARERFIVGTLTSMIWAAACAAVIVLARPA